MFFCFFIFYQQIYDIGGGIVCSVDKQGGGGVLRSVLSKLSQLHNKNMCAVCNDGDDDVCLVHYFTRMPGTRYW